MSKHQEIIDYLENLPVGKRVSVRSISNFLGVSDGTAYRAIKAAENLGLVETRPRSGTVRVKQSKEILQHLTYHEVAQVTGSEVLAGHAGLEGEFSRFLIGAMETDSVVHYLTDSGLVIVGDRTSVQLLALEHANAVLVTGGFKVSQSVLELANRLSIPVLRSSHDTYTVARTINHALSNMQIKTDIIKVAQVYRDSQSYGFLKDTDTVRDYLNLVRKNRFSRFPIINQHQVVVGVVTMRDAGDKSPDLSLHQVMTKSVFTTSPKDSLANVSQQMIAEDFEMVPVIRGNGTLLGVLTRRDVMEQMNQIQTSNLPTFSDQIIHKLDSKDSKFSFLVEPFMLESNGALASGVLTEMLTTVTHQLMRDKGKNLIIEQLVLYYLQALQLDEVVHLEPTIVRQTRRSAIIDYHLYREQQLVAKATITVKIN
ncbi:CBS-HotDog domain-containing transcription factor SpxR [Streptococcus massiliensis]|uniref:DRTGG domain/CBS domain-containing protein n=1 Tax=Streptococcus massiliensis TaxID=313439 RepID=A0A380KV55_9STRE|nr:CBS-HotDog domain-containing transcription factor SpxR [Streptococcus massiliensis]SUN75782.1 DRTGG domain/CBS domain-containing protein [Streptococcus massiliensis]